MDAGRQYLLLLVKKAKRCCDEELMESGLVVVALRLGTLGTVFPAIDTTTKFNHKSIVIAKG